MADNYLEKRYDEVFGSGGAHSAGPARPSLDQLVRKQAAASGFDPAYKVHRLQLESIVSTARASRAAEGVEFEALCGDDSACIRISDFANSVQLGELIAIIKLKATELGLGGSYSEDGSVVIGKPFQASR